MLQSVGGDNDETKRNNLLSSEPIKKIDKSIKEKKEKSENLKAELSNVEWNIKVFEEKISQQEKELSEYVDIFYKYILEEQSREDTIDNFADILELKEKLSNLIQSAESSDKIPDNVISAARNLLKLADFLQKLMA